MRLIALVFIGFLALSGCGAAATTAGTQNVVVSGESTVNTAYKPQQAIDRGDVVSVVGTVRNLPIFTRFLHNVQYGKNDKIRITSYTDEGDPIFMDLNFDGRAIHYTFDNSHDRFAGLTKGIETTSCKGIVAKQGAHGTVYVLTGCRDTTLPTDVLVIPLSLH